MAGRVRKGRPFPKGKPPRGSEQYRITVERLRVTDGKVEQVPIYLQVKDEVNLARVIAAVEPNLKYEDIE